MAERKQYPNVSDEELDRRGEEALRRMLQASPNQHPSSQKHAKPEQRQPQQRQPHQRQQRQRRRGGRQQP